MSNYFIIISGAVLLAITIFVIGIVLLGDDGRLSLVIGIIAAAVLILIDVNLQPETKPEAKV